MALVLVTTLALASCAGARQNARSSDLSSSSPPSSSASATANGPPLNGPTVNGSMQEPAVLNAPVLNAPTPLNGPPLNGAHASTPSSLSPPPIRVEMMDPRPTAFAEDLAKLGLSAEALPPIEKLDPRVLRGVMKLIAKSLGASCTDCHEESDFGAPTPRKRIAVHMWNSFAASLAMKGGAPLFCDSCHQGRMTVLDRHDERALRAWMDQAFVAKLQRTDGQEHNCETCHGTGTGQSGAPFLKAWSAL